jgi:hypothetical protein
VNFGRGDDVGTGSGTDRVSTLDMGLDDENRHPVATAPGTDLIAPASPLRILEQASTYGRHSTGRLIFRLSELGSPGMYYGRRGKSYGEKLGQPKSPVRKFKFLLPFGRRAGDEGLPDGVYFLWVLVFGEWHSKTKHNSGRTCRKPSPQPSPNGRGI